MRILAHTRMGHIVLSHTRIGQHTHMGQNSNIVSDGMLDLDTPLTQFKWYKPKCEVVDIVVMRNVLADDTSIRGRPFGPQSYYTLAG